MKSTLKFVLLASTALVAFATPADAAPVVIAFAGTVLGGVATAFATKAALVWSTVLGQAAVAGVLAGLQMAFAPSASTGAGASEITLNRIQPVTEGLILYGERMLGGSIVARSTSAADGKEHKRYHSVIPLACHEIEGAVEAWIGETLVWTATQYALDAAAVLPDADRWGQIDSDFKGKFALSVHNGSGNQAAEARYYNAVSEWAATAQGRGIAYVYFEADFDGDLFPQGVETITVRARGKRVYDPRDGLTKYTSNVFLHVRDYVLTPEMFGGIGWSAADIDDAAIIANANIAEEQIPLTGGGTEDRYAFNGVLNTADSPKKNLDRLSTAWTGWWTVDRGKLVVGGAAYEPPVHSIDEDLLVAPVKVKARRAFEDQFNIVKAIYADPDERFTPTDLPVLTSETYRLVDNGEELIRDLAELPGETSFARGQRLTKQVLLKGRRQRSVELSCNLGAWPIKLGDNVMVTIPRRGWASKVFEVTGRSVAIRPGDVRVSLSLIENGPDIFNWLTSEETAKPAGGVSTLPSPTAKPTLTAPAAGEELYETRGGGGVKTRVLLTSTTTNPFVAAWQFAWRLSSESTDNLRPLTQSGTDTLDDIAPGTYVFGARCQTKRGIWSDWSYSPPVAILGVNEAPEALSGLSVQAFGGGIAMMRWQRHPSLDVQQGGRIELRHSGQQSGASWQSSTSIGKSVFGGSTEVTLPLKAGTYLARPFDAQGIPGPVATVSTTAASIVPTVQVAQTVAHPAFAGTKVGCAVAGSNLELSTGQVLATYDIAGAMDLGSVQAVRLISDVQVIIGRRSDLFWNSGGSSFWQRGGDAFWTAAGAFGDVDIQVRSTTDDPAGSPVWSEFTSFDAAEFDGRAFEFRAVLTAENTEYSVDVTGLTITATQAA
jgi:hypothetical protein